MKKLLAIIIASPLVLMTSACDEPTTPTGANTPPPVYDANDPVQQDIDECPRKDGTPCK